MANKHVFTSLEKKLFMSIIKPYATIIENKNTDSSTLRIKNIAWEKITKEYNSSPQVETMVHPKQLRRLWLNSRQRQREALRKKRLLRMAAAAEGAAAMKVEIEENDLDSELQESEEVQIVNFMNETDTNKPDLSRIPTPPVTVPNPPATSICVTSSFSLKEQQQYFLEKEYTDKYNRATEIHAMEKELLTYKIREAKAKAERAELLLQWECSQQGQEAPVSRLTEAPVAQLAEFVRDYQS